MSLFVYDRLLGYAPNPGFSGAGFGGSFHTISPDGLRFNGQSRPPSSDGAILAVGDSFTYGDEVSNRETWPAQLQKLTGRRVLNGGVTGYGFDQVVLRTERLVARHRPSIVVLSFIAHDVERSEMRRVWWRAKPWFAIEEDRLVLKGVPVPQHTPRLQRIGQRLDRVLDDFPPSLQHMAGYHQRVHPRGHGLAICQRLIGRLAELRSLQGPKIALMAQYPRDAWSSSGIINEQRRVTGALLDCAARHGLASLDTFPRLATEPTPSRFYAVSHMNARGNAMVASLLAATLPTLLQGQDAP